jgi:isopenicillin N synthase-like dioxygenase
MTNGRYKSVEHRVVTSQERAKLFVALFYSAGMDVGVAPSSKIVNEDQQLLYRKFIHDEYIRYYLSKQLKGKHPLADFAKLDISNN